MADRQLKKVKTLGTRHIPAPREPAIPTNAKHPVFCLRYLAPNYTLADCSSEEAFAFVSKLAKLCDASWQTIQNSPREGLGHERMPVKQIRANLSKRSTPDVQELLVFRFGAVARILGFRNDRVFEVYLVDPKGSSYDH